MRSFRSLRAFAPCIDLMARGRLDTEAPPGAVPGLSSSYADEVFREASWGFGWSVLSDWKGVSSGLGLSSRRAYCHSGHGLAFAWVDPQYELVGAYLPAEDTSRLLRQYPWEIRRNSGAFLFADAVTPAIVDR